MKEEKGTQVLNWIMEFQSNEAIILQFHLFKYQIDKNTHFFKLQFMNEKQRKIWKMQ